jgi:zinc finger BED domain-containing protein 5/7/8/9
VNPNVKAIHCVLHREALASKPMGSDLKKTLNIAVQTINFVKANAKHSRIFAAVCDDMGADHSSLLLHTEVRWLSRGKKKYNFCEFSFTRLFF